MLKMLTHRKTLLIKIFMHAHHHSRHCHRGATVLTGAIGLTGAKGLTGADGGVGSGVCGYFYNTVAQSGHAKHCHSINEHSHRARLSCGNDAFTYKVR